MRVQSSENKRPEPYIQNRVGWCWVVAAKVIGCQYKRITKQKSFTIELESPSPMLRCKGFVTQDECLNGVITADMEGLRPEYAGRKGPYYLVDAWQRAIVLNAGVGLYEGFEGNAQADNESKERALKYVVTGKPDCPKLSVAKLGECYREGVLSEVESQQIEEQLNQKNYLLANFQVKGENFAHTVVLMPGEKGKIGVYDPWDGRSLQVTQREAFHSGIRFSLGEGIIKWVQYLTEKAGGDNSGNADT